MKCSNFESILISNALLENVFSLNNPKLINVHIQYMQKMCVYEFITKV